MTRSAKRTVSAGAAVAVAFASTSLPDAAGCTLADTYEGTRLAAAPIKPYAVNPPPSGATIEKRRGGNFSGTCGQVWVKPSKEEIAAPEKRRGGRSAKKWPNQQEHTVRRFGDGRIEGRSLRGRRGRCLSPPAADIRRRRDHRRPVRDRASGRGLYARSVERWRLDPFLRFRSARGRTPPTRNRPALGEKPTARTPR